MKQYPTYKDSGIQGIDVVPNHWYFSPLKYISYIKGRIGWQGLKSDEFIEDGPFLITGMNFKNGKIRWEEVYHITEERYNEAPEIQLKTGDVLMTKDGTIGKLLFVDEIPSPGKASLNSHLLVIRPLKNIYFPKYLYYQLDSHLFKKHIEDTKTGTTFYGITQEAVGNFKMLIPDFKEQLMIASFLDHKTSEIDQLIAAKEELIAKLEAQRKAIINEAVTGQAYKTGLIPTPNGKEVKFKDSGIEWMDEIPEQWKVVKLKYIVNKIGSGVTPRGGSEVYTEEGIPLLRSQNIHFDGLRLEGVARIPEVIHQKMSSTVVLPNDVLLNITGASIGRCFYVDDNLGEANVNQHVCIIRPELSKISSEYLNFFISSSCGQFQISSGQDGTSREGLNFEEIKNFLITLPPKSEMKIIADWIQKRLNDTNSIKKQTIQSIEKLKLYKQSLITEAVTGKIDVRDWQKE